VCFKALSVGLKQNQLGLQTEGNPASHRRGPLRSVRPRRRCRTRQTNAGIPQALWEAENGLRFRWP
jgi:hypothetical protein